MTLKCVRALEAMTTAAALDILVIDNGSGDGSAETLRRDLPSGVELLALPENLGFGRGNNVGLRRALDGAPVENAILEGLRCIGIRNAFTYGRIGKTGEAREFTPTAFRHGVGGCGAEVAEKQDRLVGGKCLTHEQQRRLRREE